MSLKNYKSLNFEKHHALTAEDMNVLTANDVLLYNKINALPRGVIGFAEKDSSYAQFIRKTVQTESSSGTVANDGSGGTKPYTILKKNSTTELECLFKVESARLVEMSIFIASIRAISEAQATSWSRQAVFRLAFFVKQASETNWTMLNSDYKSNKIVDTGYMGSVSSSFIANLTPGEYSVKVGAKVHNASPSGLEFGENNVMRPTQIVVEDIGSFIGPNAEVEYEF